MSRLRPHPTEGPQSTSGRRLRYQRGRPTQRWRRSPVKQRASTNIHLRLLHRLLLPPVTISEGARQIFDPSLPSRTERASQRLMSRYRGLNSDEKLPLCNVKLSICYSSLDMVNALGQSHHHPSLSLFTFIQSSSLRHYHPMDHLKTHFFPGNCVCVCAFVCIGRKMAFNSVEFLMNFITEV